MCGATAKRIPNIIAINKSKLGKSAANIIKTLPKSKKARDVSPNIISVNKNRLGPLSDISMRSDSVSSDSSKGCNFKTKSSIMKCQST